MNLKGLKLKANNIRRDIVKMVHNAKSGHPGGALGLAEIYTALYFNVLKHDPKRPRWKERDRVVMSNGHACPVLYSAMAESGYFPVEELMSLRKLGSRLQGHPAMHHLPGVEISSGSLGQGMSVAVGKALALKLDRINSKVFAMISEGDLNEGSTWEAINGASKWRLDNLVAVVDRNNVQICGTTDDVWPLEPLDKKFRAFNWETIKINGNDMGQVLKAFRKARKAKGPIAIIAKNTLGKGTSFMENKSGWHGKAPDDAELEQALAELDAARKRIR